jgi:hypothetical protein
MCGYERALLYTLEIHPPLARVSAKNHLRQAGSSTCASLSIPNTLVELSWRWFSDSRMSAHETVKKV